MKGWIFFCLIHILIPSGICQENLPTGKLERQSTLITDTLIGALMIEEDGTLIPYHIQNLKSNVFNQAPPVNFLNTAIGKVVGMNMLRAQGGLEAASRIIFRGHRSLNQNNQPLMVLDGIPMHEGWEMLNPEDIEEISVLNGANSAALYGSHAQNGVIMIQTKKGAGQPAVRYSTSYQVNFPDPLIEFQQLHGQGNDLQYNPMAVRSWGAPLQGQEVPHWSPDPTLANKTYAYKSGYDFKKFLRQGHRWSSHLGVSGNVGPVSSYFSYAYLDAAGILPNNDLSRHHVLLRLSSHVRKKLSLDAKLNYIREDHQNLLPPGNSYANPYRNAYRVPPNLSNEDISNYEYLDAEGQLRQHFWLPGNNGSANPYWTLHRNTNEQRTELLFSMVEATYHFSESLSLLWRAGFEQRHSNMQEKLFNDSYIIAAKGKYSVEKTHEFMLNNLVHLTYSKQLTSALDIQWMLGVSSRVLQEEYLQGNTGKGLIIPNLFTLHNTHDAQTTSGVSKRKVHSLYTHNKITWKDQVRLDMGLRNDWSSTLAPGQYAQIYPFAATSILLSKMVEMPSWINQVKFRAAYSKTGNDFAPYQLYRQLITPADGVDGFAKLSDQMHDTDLKPERTSSREIGLDFQFLKERVQFWTTLYHTTTQDHVISVPIPVTAGANALLTNGGEVRNRGIEFSMYLKAIEHKYLRWEVILHFTRNRNEVVSLHSELERINLNKGVFRTVVHEKGSPWGQIYSSYIFERNASGSILVYPDGSPKVTVRETPIANMSPKWLSGLQQIVHYRNLSLSFSIDIRKGGSMVSVTDNLTTGGGYSIKTAHGRNGGLVIGDNFLSHETAVTESGEINKKAISAEQFWSSVSGCCAPVGEVWVKDATNARLRDITLSYSPDLTKFGFVKDVEISLMGRNLFFLFNKAKIIDPEVIYGAGEEDEGWEMFSPPPFRSIGCKLSIDI